MLRSLLAALALLLALAGPPALAQSQDAQPEGEGPSSSPAALADVLENEQARQRLIDDLRRMADKTPEATTQAAEPTLPERVAASSQAAVERTWQRLREAASALAGLGVEGAIDWQRLASASLDLGLLIAATIAAYLIFRRIARLFYRRASDWVVHGAAETTLLRRSGAALVAAAVDGITILLAWTVGWALALFAMGEPGALGSRAALFLNAFAALEAIKAVLRLAFATRDDGLRLLPLAAEDATYWYAWLAHLVSFVGYGALVVVPIVTNTISPALGQIVYVGVVVLGFVYALAILLQNRRRVRGRLEGVAERTHLATVRVVVTVLAHVWHGVAIAYLAALTVVLLTQPERALPFMAGATAQTLAAIGIGVLVAAAIGRAISRGIHLPEATRAKFPQLESRLNAFIPRGLQVMRFVILVVVAGVVLDAWHIFAFGDWLATDRGREVLSSLIALALIALVAAIAWIALASWIDYALSAETGGGEPNARQRTLLALFRNALAVVIITLTTMIVLSELGIDIGPLLAGAGVLGLALGFGAQKLVQDIIGGVFIQLENAINTGDWVTAGGISGTAERLSIRSVGLRDLEGTFHIVPFSSVDTVSNYNRDFAYHVGIYGVAYREDTDEVVQQLIVAFRELMQDPEIEPLVLGDLEVSGVTQLADSSVNIRIRIMTRPGVQWMVGRGYNRIVKKTFDAAGIEIPFPHQTLYFGQDKDGSAPPAHVRMLEAARARSEGDGERDGVGDD